MKQRQLDSKHPAETNTFLVSSLEYVIATTKQQGVVMNNNEQYFLVIAPSTKLMG